MMAARSMAVIVLISSYIGATESIYGMCSNEELTFNCSDVGLTDIPGGEHIPSYMETLDFSNNHIGNITFLDFPAVSSSLVTLDLSRNQISVLKGDALRLLTHLVSLDLSNNILSGENLNERMFYDLRKLVYLNMEKNPLRRLKSNTFTFMELPALENLDLSHCEISVLEANSLDLSSLRSLDLSWNQIRSFSKDSFRMLVNLRTLDMSHNRINVLDQVPYMPELVTWILDSNGMETVEIGKGLRDFADNIHKLSLRNNDIKRFDTDSFALDELDYLQVIDMANNKLRCDCRMRWIHDGGYNWKGKNYSFICDSPKSVRNRNLLDVIPEDLKCGLPLSKMLFIIMISTVGVLILATIIFFVIRRRRRRRVEKKAARGDRGGKYTAVYTRDDDDVRVTMADDKRLLANETDREFDV